MEAQFLECVFDLGVREEKGRDTRIWSRRDRKGDFPRRGLRRLEDAQFNTHLCRKDFELT